MGLKDGLIAEVKHESASTQKMLERVPYESFSWKPHEKSRTLGEVATHIAQVPRWISNVLLIDDYDFNTQSFKSGTAASQEELLSIFTTVRDKAIADLQAASDE